MCHRVFLAAVCLITTWASIPAAAQTGLDEALATVCIADADPEACHDLCDRRVRFPGHDAPALCALSCAAGNEADCVDPSLAARCDDADNLRRAADCRSLCLTDESASASQCTIGFPREPTTSFDDLDQAAGLCERGVASACSHVCLRKDHPSEAVCRAGWDPDRVTQEEDRLPFCLAGVSEACGVCPEPGGSLTDLEAAACTMACRAGHCGRARAWSATVSLTPSSSDARKALLFAVCMAESPGRLPDRSDDEDLVELRCPASLADALGGDEGNAVNAHRACLSADFERDGARADCAIACEAGGVSSCLRLCQHDNSDRAACTAVARVQMELMTERFDRLQTIPEIPAATALNLEESTVSRPATDDEVTAAVGDIVDVFRKGADGDAPSFAVEFAPFRYTDRTPNWALRPAANLARNIRVSAAFVDQPIPDHFLIGVTGDTGDEDKPREVYAAFGLRVPLLSTADSRQRAARLRVAQSLAECEGDLGSEACRDHVEAAFEAGGRRANGSDYRAHGEFSLDVASALVMPFASQVSHEVAEGLGLRDGARDVRGYYAKLVGDWRFRTNNALTCATEFRQALEGGGAYGDDGLVHVYTWTVGGRLSYTARQRAEVAAIGLAGTSDHGDDSAFTAAAGAELTLRATASGKMPLPISARIMIDHDAGRADGRQTAGIFTLAIAGRGILSRGRNVEEVEAPPGGGDG